MPLFKPGLSVSFAALPPRGRDGGWLCVCIAIITETHTYLYPSAQQAHWRLSDKGQRR